MGMHPSREQLMKTLYIHGSADHYGSAKILLNILRIPGNAENAIVVLPHTGVLLKDLQHLNIPVQIMNLGVLRRRYMTPWGLIGRIFLWAIAIIRLKKLIRENQVAHVYVNSANVVLGPALKKKNRIHLTWHIHEIVDQPAVLTSILACLFSKADRLIAVSKATKDFWTEQVQRRTRKSFTIALLYNGLDTAPFEKAIPNRNKYCPVATDQDLVIGMIGRIQPWKGQTYFLDMLEEFFKTTALNIVNASYVNLTTASNSTEASNGNLTASATSSNDSNTNLTASATSSNNSNSNLTVSTTSCNNSDSTTTTSVNEPNHSGQKVFAIIAGDAYPGYEHLQDELLADIKKRKLEDRVFFNGYVANTPEWMASIDLLVLSSTSPDPLPTVVLEAMASAKPVLATAQGGALEMVKENETGLIMPLNNAKAAAHILSTMIHDPERLCNMGKNGFLRVREKFSSEAFEKSFVKYWAENELI